MGSDTLGPGNGGGNSAGGRAGAADAHNAVAAQLRSRAQGEEWLRAEEQPGTSSTPPARAPPPAAVRERTSVPSRLKRLKTPVKTAEGAAKTDEQYRPPAPANDMLGKSGLIQETPSTNPYGDLWAMPIWNGIQSMPKASGWNELQKQMKGKGYWEMRYAEKRNEKYDISQPVYTQEQMKSMYTGTQTQEVGAEKSARADAARSSRPATASSSSGTNFQKYYYYSIQLMSVVNALWALTFENFCQPRRPRWLGYRTVTIPGKRPLGSPACRRAIPPLGLD
jgi:hypothetical protein